MQHSEVADIYVKALVVANTYVQLRHCPTIVSLNKIVSGGLCELEHTPYVNVPTSSVQHCEIVTKLPTSDSDCAYTVSESVRL